MRKGKTTVSEFSPEGGGAWIENAIALAERSLIRTEIQKEKKRAKNCDKL